MRLLKVLYQIDFIVGSRWMMKFLKGQPGVVLDGGLT
jgi:hypothetical protein